MGKIADIHHAAERRAMEMTARSALDPVMERLDNLVAEMRGIAAAMTTVPRQIEEGEAGRAERLRQAIASMVQATVDVTTRLSTEILSAADQLRRDLAEHQQAAFQARLQQEMAVVLQALRENKVLMAALPDAVADQVTGAVETAQASLSAKAGTPGSSGPMPGSEPSDRLQAQAWRILWDSVARDANGRAMMEMALAKARSRLGQTETAKGSQAAR